MDKLDSQFVARPSKSFHMGRYEIDEKDRSQQMAAGEHRYFPTHRRRPTHEETLEKTLLNFMTSVCQLCQRAEKNQHESCRETNDREL